MMPIKMMTMARSSYHPLVRRSAASAVLGGAPYHLLQRKQQQQRPMALTVSPLAFSFSPSFSFAGTGTRLMHLDLSKNPSVSASLPLDISSFCPFLKLSRPSSQLALVPFKKPSVVSVPADFVSFLLDVSRVLQKTAINREVLAEATLKTDQKKWKQVLEESLEMVISNYQQKNFFDTRDRGAIKNYTGPKYEKMNKALRSGDVGKDEKLKTQIDAVIKALKKDSDKLPVFQGTVYRGACLPESIVETLVPGAFFSDKAFFSTSRNKAKASQFKSNDQAVLFEITSGTGRQVAKFSKHKEEDEVLFLPNTRFEITKVEGKVVTMKELW